jgi:DNA replication protein DnaC
MSTATSTDPTLCQQCSAPARQSDIELAQSFPSLHLSILCQACGQQEEAAERERITAQRQRKEQTEREARLEIIPPEMRRTDLARRDFNAGLWIRVENWKPSSDKWLGIIGGAGQCKTRCLAGLAAKLILAGHRLHWTTAVEFQERVDDLRSDLRAAREEAAAYFKECKRTPILVLDDFGKNTWTPMVEKNLFSLIDHRKTHDLPVLWSANTHPVEILRTGELSRDRGAPLIGRILEASNIQNA